MTETAVLFGRHAALVGVLTEPASPPAVERPAVIILDAGRIHHVGPNRLHVKIARRLAGAGSSVLRFDFSGIGDSSVREDLGAHVQSVVAETREAMAFLGAVRGSRRFVLLGLCSGAMTAVRTGLQDSRVVGMALINIRGGRQDRWTTARAYSRKFLRQYWKRLVLNPRSALRPSRLAPEVARWKMLLRARKAPRPPAAAPSEPAGSAPTLEALFDRGAEVLMVFSESDVGLDLLHVRAGGDLPRWLATGRFALEVVPRSDHVFTLLESQQRLVDLCASWMGRFDAPASDDDLAAVPRAAPAGGAAGGSPDAPAPLPVA